jgi:AraC-like DNA-binding protein
LILANSAFNLTIMTKNNQDLASLVRDLESPDNYYAGRESAEFALPNNIILFSRTTGGVLDQVAQVHHRYVLLTCLETPCTVFLDARTVHLDEGESLLIFPLQSHHYLLSESAVCWLYVTFDIHGGDSWLRQLLNTPFSLGADGLDQLRRVVLDYRVMAATGETEDRVNRLRLRLANLLGAKVVELEGAKRREGRAGTKKQPDQRGAELMQRVNRYVHSHFGDSGLDVSALAQAMAVSPRTLRYYVRSRIGMGVAHYICWVRINKAKGMLQAGLRSVGETAITCGFSSLQSFSRAFRRETGEAPREFQRRR